MATLDDFMAFNFMEDERPSTGLRTGSDYETHQTTEYPYQSQFWEDEDDKSSTEDDY